MEMGKKKEAEGWRGPWRLDFSGVYSSGGREDGITLCLLSGIHLSHTEQDTIVTLTTALEIVI